MLKIAAAIVAFLIAGLSLTVRKNPGVALGLVWSLYAMEQLLQVSFSIFISRSWLINVSVFGISVIAATLLALRTKFFAGIRFPKPAIWLFLLFTLVVLSISWAPSPGASWQRLSAVAPYFLQFAIISPLCVLDRNQLDKAVKVLLYFGFFVLIGLALSPIVNRGIVLDTGGVLSKRLEANPLAVASFAGTVILGAVFKIYGMKDKRGSLFLFHIAIVAIALLVLARSGSRGQVVAVVIAMTIWLPLTARVAAKRSSLLAIATVLIFCMGLFYFVSNGADAHRWNADMLREHTSGRLDLGFQLLDVWFDSGPIYWMVGLGNSSSWEIIGFYPHVVPMEILGEEGLLGLGLFVAFCLSTAMGGYRMLKSEEIDVQSRVNLGLVLAVFSFNLALSFKQGSLIGAQSLFGSGLTAAWYSAYLQMQARKKRFRYAYMRSVQDPRLTSMPHPQSDFLRQ